ncbi:MAG: 16S rRNA (cytosine(1402)-N(4))-methyltransferase RsmH [Chloroflexi bacterium]|nr:16S rRNA (cytosine(1402)-N(4))-methyltransferase RsmH [Chloroflexota bacterium]
MGLELHHTPVMVPEVLEALAAQPGGRYIDATLGEGGHSEAILNASEPGGQVLGLDADHEAISVARERLARYGDAFLAVNANFRNIKEVALDVGFVPVHGILLDLGISSLQLDVEARGFSFRRPDPLDMRFSVEQQHSAADIVNRYSQAELADLIFHFGEEPAARRIAAAIVRARPLRTSSELAEIIARAAGGGPRRRIHPATRTFQAIRIAVNDELGALQSVLEQSIPLLGHGGRLVVISYQSLEDRIVKNFMRREASDCVCPPETVVCACGHRASLRLVSRKVVKPSEAEVAANPRSRSARLRVAERV